MDMILEFKRDMATRFEMSDLGRLSSYLGIEVKQREGSIMLSQERYAAKILEEAGLKGCNAVHIPMDAGLKLSKAEEECGVDERDYRRNIGCLRYLIHTRPDLAYSVGVLSRYMHAPKESHRAALKQVLRYLQGTTGYGLEFKSRSEKGFIGYSDSSYNVDPDDGKNTTGHVFILAETLLPGALKRKRLWLYHHVRQSTWPKQRQLNKVCGYRNFLKRYMGRQVIRW